MDPRNYHEPKPSALIKLADEFVEETGITDYWRPNTTIMHTEFARQRAQPGQIVIGADSHTCSAGGMGALAIGLGAGDVVLPLVTGQTWLSVPEVVLIEFVGEPRFGIGGKDIILHVLGVLKRNTVALDRAVEWRGPGLAHMSTDARFAIANMSTEFGAIAGVFEGDAQTAKTLAAREANKSEGLYFRADAGAEYAHRFTIDLGDVGAQVALYPSPDNCKPVAELVGTPLDGCFIGACTTTQVRRGGGKGGGLAAARARAPFAPPSTHPHPSSHPPPPHTPAPLPFPSPQEDLILAALVLEAAMKAGKTPKALKSESLRRVTPGSREIIAYLKEHGLLAIFEAAGFVVGVPGCSYCLGIAADVAGEGEVWLSSQNRNFKNRMGKGSIANLASAAAVAASAFDMTITDPAPYLAAIDTARFAALRQWIQQPAACHGSVAAGAAGAGDYSFTITEPAPVLLEAGGAAGAEDPRLADASVWGHLPTRVTGTVQRFGDAVDTDAIIPAQMMGCSPADMVKHGGRADMSEDEFLGLKAFAYVRPEFSARVAAGANIVVGGAGFGCGSSREEAVRALKASGVQAVIAKSFAFIYARNQPNMHLLGVVVSDDKFYELAGEGATVEVDVPSRTVAVGGATFPFTLTTMEERFLQAGGVEKLYKTFRKELFKALVKGPVKALGGSAGGGGGCGGGDCGTGAPAAAGGAAEGKLAW